MKKKGYIGFAGFYLEQYVKFKSDNKIDIQVYTMLVKLDSRLGTTASEQLKKCLQLKTRSDIIKVYLSFFIHVEYFLQTIDFEQVNEYEGFRKADGEGYAHTYLNKCGELTKDDEIDIQVYTKVVELDSKLGITASEQLFCCLGHTTRSDIIQVSIFTLNSHHTRKGNAWKFVKTLHVKFVPFGCIEPPRMVTVN